MASSLQKFNSRVKKYRKSHPNVSFRTAQKKVKAMGSATVKRKPAKKKKSATPRKKAVSRPAKKAATRKSGKSVSQHLAAARKGLEERLGVLAVQHFNAKKKPQKRKIMKKVAQVKASIRKLR